MLPTIVVRDFWLSPPIHIITEMKLLGVGNVKLLELILLGAHQTSWFRFFHIGMKMINQNRFDDPFATYVKLAEETFGSITGGPKPRADPPGINVKAVYFPNDYKFKSQVIQCILDLVNLVNETSEELLTHAYLRQNVLEASATMSRIKVGSELGEFCLMITLQMCALSSIGLSRYI